MKNDYNVRVPQIIDLKTAVELYYTRSELSNKDIERLFGHLSSATISRLKGKARQKMVEDNVPCWNARLVNTQVAYKTWGLAIEDLEQRYEKLKKLAV